MSHLNDKRVIQLLKENWSNYLLNTVAFIGLAYFVLLFAPMWLGARLYWLYVDANPAIFADTICDALPAMALALLIFWIVFGMRKYKSPNRLHLFLFPSLTFCCLGYFSLGLFTPNTTKHLAELRSGIHLYRVALWDAGGEGDGLHDVLFQCESLGVLCSEICSLPVSNSNSISQKISIRTDEISQTISMMDGDNELCHSGNKS